MKENEEHLKNIDQQKKKIRERYVGLSEDELDVIPAIPREDFYDETKRKRVAVYARVSTDDPRQTSSYELQKNHYTDMVNRRDDWDLVEIYADEGISGTSLQHRDSFIKMINDCKAGKIDLIVTKSVSRFARNVIDCIGYVRELKAMEPPIGVFFETENIFTLNANSEMSLSFIATLAQEESHNKSEIMNSSIEMRFKRGIFLTPVLLGYDQDEDGNLIINEEEAKIVRLIFFLYLYGYSLQQIADTLSKLNCKTKRGNLVWSTASIRQILQNERHCGDVLARKTFTPNYLDHKSKKNKRDRNQYLKRDHHERIISRDDYMAVQQMLENAKYGKQHFLPKMQVITEGVLKGFVLINTRWGGFTKEDYLEASTIGIDEDLKNNTLCYQAGEGEFDLRGFEVTRLQFLNTKDQPAVSFMADKITFSSKSRKSLDCDYIELLIHPSEKLLAVRPCTKNEKYGLKWARTQTSQTNMKTISARAFMPTLFDLLGWNTERKYRSLGVFRSTEKQQLLIFDLKDYETFFSLEKINPESGGIIPFTSRNGKTVIAYPAEWSDSFGSNIYEQRLSRQNVVISTNQWNTHEDIQEYSSYSINPTPKNDVQNEIRNLMTELKGE